MVQHDHISSEWLDISKLELQPDNLGQLMIIHKVDTLISRKKFRQESTPKTKKNLRFDRAPFLFSYTRLVCSSRKPSSWRIFPLPWPKKSEANLVWCWTDIFLYHYLVVLNVKIRIRFFGHLRALGTVRIFWKYELKRVKTSHALWLNRSQKSNAENSVLPENSNFLDVSVNISRIRTSYMVPLSQACSKRPGGHIELPKSYIYPV